ncbi:MAG TPA: hypothetical protein VLB04_10805 [Methanotrichaceae archaeon]|nr:hypothetical protein [Methanotrichaceae archaeon]
MQRASGVAGMGSGGINIESTKTILEGIKKLMKHKYGDVFLLCSVAAAFGTLLIVSALG